MHNVPVPDAIIVPDEAEAPGAELAAQSAHDAAVAEGGAQVREQLAADSAEEAQTAAELAVAAAMENAETAAAVIEAQGSAEASAAEAQSLTESIADMHRAQMAAIAALGEELRAARESSKPVPAETKTTSERPPGAGKPRWVRR